ncbi:endonuclease [Marinomonas sp. UCMA 3892]|uniref:endonuclease n=1 Tax=Marinomonas sp. UCMA 3892 TaxID=1972585 RepID=UPI002006EE94|nr:endonuclease [Marinomonas sp. UCMA 3892]
MRGTEKTSGQIARMVFYMATHYEIGDNASPENMPDLRIVKGNEKQSGQPTIGDLCTLVKWNEEFAVTDFEKRRNDRVQELQGNRNPFIDHPEFVDSIWANKC